MKKIKIITVMLSSLVSLSAWAGEFGDHCTTGLALGKLIKTECEINTIFDGKTYCFGNEQALAVFQQDPQTTIKKATEFYEKNTKSKSEKTSHTDTNDREAVLDDTITDEINGLDAINNHAIKEGKCIDCNTPTKTVAFKEVSTAKITKNCALTRHALQSNAVQ